jgi:hypothetical protein
MAKGIQLAGGYGAGGVRDALVDLITQKQVAQDREEMRAARVAALQRQAMLDAQAAEDRNFTRTRLTKQDERTERLDTEAREGKLAKEGLDLATLFPGKVVSGETLKRYPKFLHELIATPKAEQLARRSINGVAVAGDPHAGNIDFEEHEAVGPDSFELQLPVSERMRLAEERATATASKRSADEKFREEKLDRDTQHRERMAEIAAQRAAGVGGGGRGATKIVQGTDEQGRPATFLIDQEGNIVKSFGKPLSNAERTQQIDADAAAKSVTDIESLFKDEYVGPIQGRLGKASSATGLGLTPERAKFSASVAHMKNAIIKEITGAAVGVQEEGRIMGEIPDVTDPPETFRAKLEMTKRNRQYLQGRIAERTGGAPAAGAAGSGERKVGDRKTFPNGNVGVWNGEKWVKQ